jgi:DNA-binding NarL/FixJ family response regulator
MRRLSSTRCCATAERVHEIAASVEEISMTSPPPDTTRSASPITVVLADDHPALRLGLRVLLEQTPGIAVVGEADDGRAALAQIESVQPLVAVLDCCLPDLAGPAVAAEVRRRGLPTRVVALSAYRDEQFVRGMLAAGAVGYLLKDEASATIVAAVQAAARGEGWFSPAVAAWVASGAESVTDAPAGLTERELAVLLLVAQGKTNKAIAQQLAVTERTVEFHVGNVRRKLAVASRVEVAVWAKEHGLLTETPESERP